MKTKAGVRRGKQGPSEAMTNEETKAWEQGQTRTSKHLRGPCK